MLFLCNLADFCSSCQQLRENVTIPPEKEKNKCQKVQDNLAGFTFSEGTAYWGDSVFSIFHRISSAETVDVTMPSPDYLGVLNQPTNSVVLKTECERLLR